MALFVRGQKRYLDINSGICTLSIHIIIILLISIIKVNRKIILRVSISTGLPPPMSQDKKGIVRPPVTLLSLSNELLQIIADKLPSSSAAALAISNTELYSVLRPTNCLDTTKRYPTHSSPAIVADTLPGVWNSWDYNSSYRNESRREFLLLLERDFPHYIYCRRCDILHHPWNTVSVPENCESPYMVRSLVPERKDTLETLSLKSRSLKSRDEVH